MNNSTILRTSAILFAEDSENINPVIIKRKMIEGIFLELDNRKLKIFEIVDFLKSMLDLAFTEEEIVGIINESSEGYFDIIPNIEHSKSVVQLTSDRFKKLQKKVEELSFDDIIELFGQDIYEGSIENGDIRDVVYRYIYYLINTNHRTLSKIISGKKIDGEISLIEAKFKSNESDLINQFINWDNKAKDKSLYMLISYSIEYCLIVNNADSENFAESIKDKVFFLDTNILFRALGINGETREKRIISFLEKCRDNGQEFAISKYTLTEFNDTINYHLKRLNELPYAKINPEIFEYFNLNSSIAKSFYTWKAGRSMGGPDYFKMHVDGLLKKFRKQFNITIQSENIHGINTEDYNSSITDMISEIETFKQNGQFDSHEMDAKNVFFISSLRAGVDYSLSETKYYFISTDQKLRSWDYSKSDNQPIVLLPSHWMSLLLRYVSRTDSDYKAFTSFLNLKIVNDNKGLDHLDQILTGISNVTEDFEAQSIIAESIFEQKFDKILNGLPDEKQIEEVEAFAEKEIDLHLKRQKEVNKQLETDYKRKISEVGLEVENKATREAINNKLESLTQIKNEKLLRLREKEKLKQTEYIRKFKISEKASSLAKTIQGCFIAGLLIYICILIYLINTFDFFQKYGGLISIVFLVVNYFTISLLGKTLDPIKYFKDLYKIVLNRKFEKADFNPLTYEKLKKDIADLKSQIEKIDQEINVLEMQKTGS